MPRLSYFCGIAIYLYYEDHDPPTSTPGTANIRPESSSPLGPCSTGHFLGVPNGWSMSGSPRTVWS